MEFVPGSTVTRDTCHLKSKPKQVLDQRDLRVYYPDGSSCNVATPRAGRARTPCHLVKPWTWRERVLPPIVDIETSTTLSKLSVALISMSSHVHSGQATGWRQRHLNMAVCRLHHDCVTYAVPEVPASAQLARLGIKWAWHADIAAPIHLRLWNRSCWPPIDGRRFAIPKQIADACAAAVLPDGQPRPRTVFTAVAARCGLPPSCSQSPWRQELEKDRIRDGQVH